MSNHHLRNKELSLKAKGLLSQMLSLPEDWDYTLAGLSHINREKIDAIREAVKELEKAGYIVRSRERDEKGRLRGADYVIYEQPQPREPEAATSGGQPPILDLPTLENPTLDNPTLEKPTQEKPTLENPTQLNKDILSKEQSITDLSSTDSIPFHSLNPLPFAHGEAATPPERKRTEAKSNSAVEIYREIIKDNIEYDHLIQNCKIDKDRLDEIVDLKYPAPCRIAAVGFRTLAPEPDLQLSLYPALHSFTVCTVYFSVTAFTDYQCFPVNLFHKSCPRLTFIQLFQRSYLVHHQH